jgi:hypothetical protein
MKDTSYKIWDNSSKINKRNKKKKKTQQDPQIKWDIPTNEVLIDQDCGCYSHMVEVWKIP